MAARGKVRRGVVGWQATSDRTLGLVIDQVDGQAERDDPLEWRSEKSVYFVLDPRAGQVKIGVTRDPQRRLRQLRHQRHAGLELLGCLNGGDTLEIALHSKFKSYRVERAEWFSPEVLPEVKRLLDAEREWYEGVAA